MRPRRRRPRPAQERRRIRASSALCRASRAGGSSPRSRRAARSSCSTPRRAMTSSSTPAAGGCTRSSAAARVRSSHSRIRPGDAVGSSARRPSSPSSAPCPAARPAARATAARPGAGPGRAGRGSTRGRPRRTARPRRAAPAPGDRAAGPAATGRARGHRPAVSSRRAAGRPAQGQRGPPGREMPVRRLGAQPESLQGARPRAQAAATPFGEYPSRAASACACGDGRPRRPGRPALPTEVARRRLGVGPGGRRRRPAPARAGRSAAGPRPPSAGRRVARTPPRPTGPPPWPRRAGADRAGRRRTPGSARPAAGRRPRAAGRPPRIGVRSRPAVRRGRSTRPGCWRSPPAAAAPDPAPAPPPGRDGPSASCGRPSRVWALARLLAALTQTTGGQSGSSSSSWYAFAAGLDPSPVVVQDGQLQPQVRPLVGGDQRLGAAQVAGCGVVAAQLVQGDRPGDQQLAQPARQAVPCRDVVRPGRAASGRRRCRAATCRAHASARSPTTSASVSPADRARRTNSCACRGVSGWIEDDSRVRGVRLVQEAYLSVHLAPPR